MVALNHNPTDIDEGYPEGVYSFTVTDADGKWISKNENPGVCVYLEFYNEKISFNRREYLVTNLPSVKWKLKQFCASVGVDYDNESLDSDEFINKRGKATLHRRQEKEGSQYVTDRNGNPVLEKYLSVDTYLANDGIEDELEPAPF